MTEIKSCDSSDPVKVDYIERNEDEIPTPIQKSRRRSSFFAEARRKSVDVKIENEFRNYQFRENAEMVAYADLLEKEAKEWVDVSKKRKREYQETERRYNEFCKEKHTMTEKEGWSLLDEEDKTYLSNLPDFSAIESKFNYFKKLNALLEDQELTNKLNLMKELDRIEKDLEVSMAKIQQYVNIN